MEHKDSEDIIGYSGFDIFEDGYFYFENECYVADTRDRADKLMKESFFRQSDYRIVPIRIDDIMQDYGVSSGRFAMEEAAFTNFQSIAEANGIRFQARREDGTDVPLIIVEVEGTTR